MLLLALDSSHSTGSLCLQRDSTVIAHTQWQQEKSHAELIASKMRKVFLTHNIKPEDIDKYCVNVGPGSFTGIRIAVNTIKTFAYVFDRPIFCFNSLETIAESCSMEGSSLTVAINAHSELCYVQTFLNRGNWEAVGLPTVLPAVDLKNLNTGADSVFVGDAFTSYKHLVPQFAEFKRPIVFEDIPSAKSLTKLAKRTQLSPLKWNEVEPFYIRKSAPEEKRNATT